ncbi:MAG: MFS transporter, partial [Peptococcaceae bacterium]|nr:MFS transporter [Peptococcaceae bacterium]
MKKVWLMVIVTILTSITCTIAFLKIPPTMVLIMEAFGVSLTVVGLTMTVATIAQVTVSLPFGIVAAKIDPKKSMYIVLLLGFLGGVIGALSANYNILLVGRILDGACFGMASIVGPQIITMLFPPEKRGLPMGIFSIWVPLGMLTIFNLANPIAEAYSWRGVWWFSSIVIIALAIIFILVFRSPPNANGEGSSQSMVQAEQGYKSFILTAFKSRAIWNIAFSFFFFSFLYAVLNNYYSTYLVQEVGLELGTANKIYTFSIIGMAIGGIITGTILNKVNRNNHAVLLTISLVLIAFCAFFQFQVKS